MLLRRLCVYDIFRHKTIFCANFFLHEYIRNASRENSFPVFYRRCLWFTPWENLLSIDFFAWKELFFIQFLIWKFQSSSLFISFITRVFRRNILVHYLRGSYFPKRSMSACHVKGRQDKHFTIVKLSSLSNAFFWNIKSKGKFFQMVLVFHLV